MKRYVHSGALSFHILLRDVGESFDIEVVNVIKKARPDGGELRRCGAEQELRAARSISNDAKLLGMRM